MAMFQVLKNSDNSFVLYISLLIRFFIRQLQPIIWITKGYWFIFQNVRTIRSPPFLHLWKPIFVHIKPMRQNSRKISIFSGLFLNYSEEKQGGSSMIGRSTLLTYFIIVFNNSFTLTLSLTIPNPANLILYALSLGISVKIRLNLCYFCTLILCPSIKHSKYISLSRIISSTRSSNSSLCICCI